MPGAVGFVGAGAGAGAGALPPDDFAVAAHPAPNATNAAVAAEVRTKSRRVGSIVMREDSQVSHSSASVFTRNRRAALDASNLARSDAQMQVTLARTLASASIFLLLMGGAAARDAVPLFDAMPFKEWRVVGGAAKFELLPPADGGAGPTLVGKGPIERNGFLTSPREVRDFRLAVDVRLASAEFPKGEGMNSGIQIRSAEKDGAIGGLQIEVDPTERRWSGGVYDERGRGWLAPLKDNAAAMAAFKLGEWNRYEIECIGPRVRTRVNGVACAEWYDGIVSGLLAFQVHGGKACEVAFRAPAFEDLGAHAWRDGAGSVEKGAAPSAWNCALPPDARGWRASVTGSGRAQVVAADGEVLAEIEFAPKKAPDAAVATPSAREAARLELVRLELVWIELVWIEGKGAALLDGARVAGLSFAKEPARVTVSGAGAVVGTHAVLERVGAK